MTRHNWCLSRGEQISHRNGLIYNLGTLPQISGRNWDGLNINKNIRNRPKHWKNCVRRLSRLDASGHETLQVPGQSRLGELPSCVVAMSSVVPEPFGENPGQSKTSDSEETDVNASFNTAVAATMSECFWLVYKVYKQHSPPGITAPPTIPACALQYQVGTKRENTLKVPFARTELCLRSFLPEYGRVWNTLMETTAIGQAKPLTNFKARINTWIKEQPPWSHEPIVCCVC